MATWQDRWRDAQGFWELSQAAYDPESRYANPAASNAMLAVIAANDAVCLRLGRRQSKGESHTEAAEYLKLACKGTPWEEDARDKSRQLVEMLRQKTAAQYLGKPLGADRVEKIMKQAERFMEWVEDLLPAAGATPWKADGRTA